MGCFGGEEEWKKCFVGEKKAWVTQRLFLGVAPSVAGERAVFSLLCPLRTAVGIPWAWPLLGTGE